MSRLFISNFSFEHLQDRKDHLKKHLRRFEAEMACVWLAVAKDGDFIQCEEEVPASYLERMKSLGCADVTFVTPSQIKGLPIAEATCWGWTLPLRGYCDAHSLHYSAPFQEAIWLINSRSYSCQLESELRCGIDGTTVIRSEQEAFQWCAKALRMPDPDQRHWLFKPELSQSGRGQFRSIVLNSELIELIFKGIEQHHRIIAEPFVEKAREVGCQWEIALGGAIEFVGAVELFSSDRGAYLGSATGITPMNFTGLSRILKVQRVALEEIASAGYFGPIGIDAMLYHDEAGQLRTRPLQDINARWTMGRIALGWEKILGQGQFTTSKTAPNKSAIRLSPATLGGVDVHSQCWWDTLGASGS